MEATKSFFGSITRRVAIVASLAAIMLAAGLWLWPRVSFWQQQRLVVRLVEELEQANSPTSLSLRRIATLGYPAIEALVLAATSQRSQIAIEARQIVEEQLATWKNRALADNQFKLGVPASILASSLADHVRELGPHGQRWASRLSLELVDLAEQMPAVQAVPILDNCSRVLAAVTPIGPRMRTLTDLKQPITSNETALRVPSVKLPYLASEQAINGNEATRDLPLRSIADELAMPLDAQGSTPLTPLPRDSNWIPDWSRQTPNVSESHEVEQIPLNDNVAPVASDPVVSIPSPDEMALLFEEFQREQTPELLSRLSDANHYTAAVIRSVLKARGIESAELSLAARLVAADSIERLQLIDELKVLPARTARRWFRELLSDKDAEVRLKALTAMATTNDPALVGIAREVAVHDSDSRVTELASRIIRDAR